jgi:alpha-beta hydrolase superfamily lysophospholipase
LFFRLKPEATRGNKRTCVASGFSRKAVAGAAILGLLLLFASSSSAAQRVTFRTDDGVTLSGTWYEPSSRMGPAVILVHMLSRTRREWEPIAQRLASDGIGALAFDLRGHGESGAGPLGTPDRVDYSTMVLDLRAARRFLAQRSDVQQARVGVAGASLGANLAALLASADPSIASVALLSPSLDYRGLRIEAAARKVSRPMLLVAGDDDPYAARSARDLQKAGGGPRELLVLRQAGHGTAMVGRDPTLAGALVDWFRRTLL